MFTKI